MVKNYLFSILFLAMSSVLMAQVVCQEQLTIDNGSSGQVHGQSITMNGCNGTFNAIELERRDNGAAIEDAILMIYKGEDLMATPMYVQEDVVIPAGSGKFTVEFDASNGDLSFFDGEQYTFLFDNTPTWQLFVAGNNLYTEGRMYLNTAFNNDFDWWFQLSIDPLEACQEQLVVDNGSSGQVHGQSVTMDECSGMFNSIDMFRRDAGSEITNATISIYEGENITSEPLYTQSGVTIPAGSGKFRIDFNGGKGSLAFEEGKQYTFLFNNLPTWQLFVAGNDLYTEGRMYLNSAFNDDFDWWFKVNTESTTVCQEQLVIDNGASGQVHGQSITMTGCSGVFNSIEMDRRDEGAAITNATLSIYRGEDIEATPMYTQSGITIPAGSGKFQVNLNGGTGSLEFFQGEQYTFLFNNLPTWQLFVAGGDLYTDGRMYLNTAFNNDFDWWFKLNIQDALDVCQEQPVVDNGASGQVHGQSITMNDCNGTFDAIDLYRRDAGAAITNAVLSIYDGEEIENEPIYTQNVVIPEGNNRFRIHLEGGEGSLEFLEGQQYTFLFNNLPTWQLFVAGNDLYPEGRMYLNTAFNDDFDWWFNVAVNASDDEPVGLTEVEPKAQGLYPNPAHDFIQVTNIEQPEAFKVFDVVGNEVFNGIVTETGRINVQNLTNGMYFLQVNGGRTIKFLKE